MDDPALGACYDETSLWSARFGLFLLDELELRGGRTVLDLGCGTGFPLFELAHAHGPIGRFVGADVWAEGLRRAGTKATFYALPNAALVRADGARLPFRGGTFDLVVSNLGVNNFEDPRRALSEIARLLRAGGLLALTTNLRGHMEEFYEVYRALLLEKARPDWLARLEANASHRPDEATLVAMAEGADLRVTRLVRRRFTLRYLDGSALLRHALTWIGFLGGWRAVVDPEAEGAVFLELERRLNEKAAREGSLGMTVPALYLEAEKIAA